MKILPDEVYVDNCFKPMRVIDKDKNTTYIADKIVALKDGHTYPVYITYGKHGGMKLLINEQSIPVSDYIYNGSKRMGYSIYLLNNFNIHKAIEKEKTYIEQCKKGMELGKQRLLSLQNFIKDYPEYQI